MNNNEQIARHFESRPDADVYVVAKKFGELVTRVRRIKQAVAWGQYRFAAPVNPVSPMWMSPMQAAAAAAYWAAVQNWTMTNGVTR